MGRVLLFLLLYILVLALAGAGKGKKGWRRARPAYKKTEVGNKPNVSVVTYGGDAFVCITGQVERLELRSKIDKLIKPLLMQFKRVHVGLALSNNGYLRSTNVGSKVMSVSPYSLQSAIQEIMRTQLGQTKYFGQLSAQVYSPFHNVSTPINEGYYENMMHSKISRDIIKPIEWHRTRVENHLRQFEALNACHQAIVDNGKPKLSIRVRDDTFSLKIDFDEVMNHLYKNREGGDRVYLVQNCAAWLGINDHIAFLGDRAVSDYFTAPLRLYGRKVATYVVNPETYYMESYLLAGLTAQMSPKTFSVTARYGERDGCMKFVPIGASRCERASVEDIMRDTKKYLPCLAPLNSPTLRVRDKAESILSKKTKKKRKILKMLEVQRYNSTLAKNKLLDVIKNEMKPIEIDVGIVYSCAPQRFHKFEKYLDLSYDLWNDTVRFLVGRFECDNPADMVALPDSLGTFPLIKVEPVKPWTRSSNRNLLMSAIRPGARLLLVDVDVYITNTALLNLVSNVFPGVIYFPIVWSMYSPESIAYIERKTFVPVEPYSPDEGDWRIYGFGMVGIHADDVTKLQWNESFVGWGGEDKAFHQDALDNPSIEVVRTEDFGLTHIYHAKDCSNDVQATQKLACEGTKSDNTYSPKAQSFFNNSVTVPAVVIILPVSYPNDIDRVTGIASTWAKSAQKFSFLRVIFFAAKSEAIHMKEMFPTLEFLFADVPNLEYPPVYRNTAMLKHAWFNYEFDWLLKVDSDTYVNLIRLQVLLRMLSQSSNAFLGNRGTDMKEDTKALHPAVQFCLGGPGFLISRMTLERTVNHLDGCVLENKDNAKLWFDDVIISQCIQNYTSLGCHEGDNLDNVTYTEMNFYEHHDNRSPQYTTVTYHPLNDSKSMGEYHEEVMKPRPGYTQF